ncbi:MAG: ABC transporter ATP-binding protein [Candidatus Bathyarchaeia archaeon]
MPLTDVPTIEAVKLTKQYGSFLAVCDLNLKIEGSKCVGFLGPNGAGKTTTLKMFTDLIRPTSGEALINGINVHTNKKTALASVAALIETPEIYPSLTPREALKMIAEIRGIPADQQMKNIETAVAEVRMEEWMDKRVGRMSKGMKQRINIAAALISHPSILLLDEPTTGLDPRGMTEVRDIIKGLKSEKRLIFMSSHLLSEVSDVCDEVAMIDHGKLLVYDSITNITSKFGGGQNIVEVGFPRPIDERVTKSIEHLPQVVSVNKKDEKNLTIKFTGDLEAQGKLLSDLVGLNLGVISYRPSSSELEDAYLKLITATL